MPSSDQWKEIEMNKFSRLYGMHKDFIETCTNDALALVNFFRNQNFCNSSNDVEHDYPEYAVIIDEFGDVCYDILRYALKEKHINPNEKIIGKTVFEHYIELCIEGSRYYHADLRDYGDTCIDLFLESGADASRKELVDILLQYDRKNYYEEKILEDFLEYDRFETQAMLLKLLWDRLDKTALSLVEWDTDFLRCTRQVTAPLLSQIGSIQI